MSNPYAAIDLEPIEAGLYSKLKAALGSTFVTYGRRHVPPPDLSPEQQPALFSFLVRESKSKTKLRTPGQTVVTGFIVIYCYQSAANEIPGQETVLGSTQLNALRKAVDNAIAPDEWSGTQTLGGLVQDCWIEGDIERDPGVFGQQAAAIIPIHILIP